MKYFSMFSGIGGFELGIKRAYNNQQSAEIEQDRQRGNRDTDEQQVLLHTTEKPPLCVGYSEIDKYAIATYKKHFGGHKNYGNIKTINPETLPDFNLLVGGFPCQAFSIAGKRKGFQDTRGTLFFDIARIAAVKKPKMLLLENVKGLLNHDKGCTFAKILKTLWELGYDVEWCVLNSKNFGVPQNRERVFIIGHLRGTSSRQIFPIRKAMQKLIQERENATKIVGCLNARYWKMGKIDTYINQLNQPNHSNDRIYGSDGLSPSLNTMQGGNRQPFVKPVLTPMRPEKRQNGRRFKNEGEEMFTLTGQDQHGVIIRRLTPIECARLQGFPDDWVLGSDTQKYKQLGNAVTVNVIEYVIGLIIRKGVP